MDNLSLTNVGLHAMEDFSLVRKEDLRDAVGSELWAPTDRDLQELRRTERELKAQRRNSDENEIAFEPSTANPDVEEQPLEVEPVLPPVEEENLNLGQVEPMFVRDQSMQAAEEPVAVTNEPGPLELVDEEEHAVSTPILPVFDPPIVEVQRTPMVAASPQSSAHTPGGVIRQLDFSFDEEPLPLPEEPPEWKEETPVARLPAITDDVAAASPRKRQRVPTPTEIAGGSSSSLPAESIIGAPDVQGEKRALEPSGAWTEVTSPVTLVPQARAHTAVSSVISA